ncbi:hypothetical protein FHS07_002946 [Microbacterium proteolyticum]|uniref:DUF4365 domain-containing protein n=1 Tax=Microbacterium proteolyticum TaxID=1572644 RepID=A0A7W5CK94_9MICO|nr:DUF4365 domain-containing protein [Microbacterium proteolyticum]MBB3159228.1 hypothetical protein [Microbacterium proteolyticum]
MPSASASRSQTGQIGERAVSHVRQAVLNGTGYLFREQTNSDYGIDAHVETLHDDDPTGHLIALQIKGGRSAFAQPSSDGWTFRVKARHASYWLNHSLPVVLVLVDVDGEKCYWQVISSSTLRKTGKSFTVNVPARNTVRSAALDWSKLAAARAADVEAAYTTNLVGVPPAAAQHLRKLYEGQPAAAFTLAAEMAAGREAPSAIVKELSSTHLAWLDGVGVVAWDAMAAFAKEHSLHVDAANILEHLATIRPASRAGSLADAAILLRGVDDHHSKKLLEQAQVADADASAVLLAGALIDSANDTHARTLLQRLDVHANSFRAHTALQRGDDTAAIDTYTQIVSDFPDDSAIIMLLARIHLKRALSSHARATDVDDGLRWAELALRGRRKWTADTAEPLSIYARALGMQSRYSEVLQATTIPPLGTASSREVQSIHVAEFAADAARAMNRRDQFESIIRAVQPEDDQRYLAASLRLDQNAPAADHIAHHREALTRAIRRNLISDAYDAAVFLALQGVDESDKLISAAIEPRHRQLVSAVAAGINNPHAALPLLRSLASSDVLAAEVVIDLQFRNGDTPAAVEACEYYYTVFSLPSFLIRKVGLLLRTEQADEAASTLERLLANHALVGDPFVSAHVRLGEHYGSHGEWEIAAGHFTAAVEASIEVDRAVFWNLINCRLNLDDVPAAHRLLNAHQVEPRTEHEIRMWAHVMADVGWTDATGSVAVALALRPDTSAELAAAMVGSIVLNTRGVDSDAKDEGTDLRPTVSGNLHRDAFSAINVLIDMHGDAFPLRSLDTDADDFLPTLLDLLREHDPRPLMTLVRQIELGNAPLGVLSDARHVPYAHTLARRANAVRAVSHADADAHAMETDTALEARNERVVVDLSAIEVAHHLDAWNECVGSFSAVEITSSQRADSVRSVTAAINATAELGAMGVDGDGDLVLSESNASEQLEILRRCEAIERAARGCRATDVGNEYTAAPALSRFKMRTWAAPIELAARTGSALWSDDVAQRKLAAAVGVRAFGTVNLLEGLRFAEWERAGQPNPLAFQQQQHRFVLDLLARRVVDQPITVEDVLQDIAAHPSQLAPSTVAVSRAAWWRNDSPLDAWSKVMTTVATHAPQFARVWQAAGMTGAAEATPDEYSPRVLAVLALMGTTSDLSSPDIVDGLMAADHVCRQIGLAPASEHIAWAVAVTGTAADGQTPEDMARDLSDTLTTQRDLSA